MTRSLPALFLALLVGCPFSAAQEETSGQEETSPAEAWHTDYETGVTEAREEGKDLLLVFTGTEWIEMCRVFEKEILETAAFVEATSEAFSLVKLEYPRDNRLPAGEAKQKQLLRDAYRVRGFPTVVLTDAKGRPFGISGYQPAEPKVYASRILAIRKAHEERRKALAEAADLEGVERAKRLVEGIPELPGNLAARYYGDEMRAAVEADPEGEVERTSQYSKFLADVEYSKRMQKLAKDGKWAEMIELTEDHIRENELEGKILQKALLNKAGVQERQANTTGMIETLLRIVEIDPESGVGKAAQRRLDRLKADQPQPDSAPSSGQDGE